MDHQTLYCQVWYLLDIIMAVIMYWNFLWLAPHSLIDCISNTVMMNSSVACMPYVSAWGRAENAPILYNHTHRLQLSRIIVTVAELIALSPGHGRPSANLLYVREEPDTYRY
jgi:hypothetical protein